MKIELPPVTNISQKIELLKNNPVSKDTENPILRIIEFHHTHRIYGVVDLSLVDAEIISLEYIDPIECERALRILRSAGVEIVDNDEIAESRLAINTAKPHISEIIHFRKWETGKEIIKAALWLIEKNCQIIPKRPENIGLSTLKQRSSPFSFMNEEEKAKAQKILETYGIKFTYEKDVDYSFRLIFSNEPTLDVQAEQEEPVIMTSNEVKTPPRTINQIAQSLEFVSSGKDISPKTKTYMLTWSEKGKTGRIGIGQAETDKKERLNWVSVFKDAMDKEGYLIQPSKKGGVYGFTFLVPQPDTVTTTDKNTKEQSKKVEAPIMDQKPSTTSGGSTTPNPSEELIKLACIMFDMNIITFADLLSDKAIVIPIGHPIYKYLSENVGVSSQEIAELIKSAKLEREKMI